MREIASLLEVMRKDRQRSVWAKECTLAMRLDALQREIEEVREALDGSDHMHTRDELGDILLDVFALLAAAEDEGIGHTEDIARMAKEKMLRRKPWILTDEEVSSEEEVRRWKQAKKEEKSNN